LQRDRNTRDTCQSNKNIMRETSTKKLKEVEEDKKEGIQRVTFDNHVAVEKVKQTHQQILMKKTFFKEELERQREEDELKRKEESMFLNNKEFFINQSLLKQMNLNEIESPEKQKEFLNSNNVDLVRRLAQGGASLLTKKRV
jgi:hypothetical protein